jgi:DnaJ family protein C protein 7
VADCSSALDLDENYLKALLRRAKCYMELSDFDEAVRDYERALKMDNSRGNILMLDHPLSTFYYRLIYAAV